MNTTTLTVTAAADDLFESFDIEELEVLEISDSVALPAMGASSGIGGSSAASPNSVFCCSSSSSSSSCCCC